MILSILTSLIWQTYFRKESTGSLIDTGTKLVLDCVEMRLEPIWQEANIPFLHSSSFLPGNYTSWIHKPSVSLAFLAISSRKIVHIMKKYVLYNYWQSHVDPYVFP